MHCLRPALATALLLAAVACASEPAGCAFRVVRGEPPEWARTGFTPGAQIHYATSGRGDMLALIFGYPLFSPPAPDRSNKILWRSRVPVEPGPLRIEARLNGTGAPERVTVGEGPGPSIVDLPRPGCWRLELAWGPHTDSIDLEYVRPRDSVPG